MRWAVLTGDIVDSSDLAAGDLDAVMASLKSLTSSIEAWNTDFISVFSRRGGDGWQMAINQPEHALRVALLVQATLIALNARTRIAAATGHGTLPDTPEPDLNSAHGPVFQASGRALETLSSHSLITHAGGGALKACFRLADHISQGWTQAQARTLCLLLPPAPGPRRLAAKTLGVSRQAVDQALHAAGYPALIDAIAAIEEIKNG